MATTADDPVSSAIAVEFNMVSAAALATTGGSSVMMTGGGLVTTSE